MPTLCSLAQVVDGLCNIGRPSTACDAWQEYRASTVNKVQQPQPKVRVRHGLVRRERLLQPGASLCQHGDIKRHAALLLQQPLKDGRESEDELQPRCTRRARELTLAGFKERGEPLQAGLARGRGRRDLPARLKISYYPPD